MKKDKKYWKIKVFVLLLFLLPSFICFPVSLLNTVYFFSWVQPSISVRPTDGQILYLLFSLLAVRVVAGDKNFITSITAAGIASISIVFMGSFVAYIRIICSFPDAFTCLGKESMYYMSRLINILTVVPISLSLFLVIPFSDIEHNIVNQANGVSELSKFGLLISRVVNNIRYSVFSNVMLVVSEERYKDHNVRAAINKGGVVKNLINKMVKNIHYYVFLSATWIAYSLEYIPLWSYEISRIPNKK